MMIIIVMNRIIQIDALSGARLAAVIIQRTTFNEGQLKNWHQEVESILNVSAARAGLQINVCHKRRSGFRTVSLHVHAISRAH